MIEAKRIPNLAHATKYFQDLFAFEDLQPTEAEKIVPDGPSAQNAAAIEARQLRLLKHLDRANAVKATIKTDGWSLIEQKAFRRVREIEQEHIWPALAKGEKETIDRLRAEHDGLVTFFGLVNNIDTVIAAINNELDKQAKIDTKIYVDGEDPLTVIEKEQ